MKYLKFEEFRNYKDLKKSVWKNLFIKFLSKIFPVANPDFEEIIDNVKYWMIEFSEAGIPEREIGLNKNQTTILKMPYKNNYGYWTDNNLVFGDFLKKFSCEEIDRELFEEKWQNVNV